MRQYIIEGNEIKMQSVQVERVGLVSDLLPTLVTFQPLEMDRLPRNMSYIKVTPNGTENIDARIVVTQEPRVRTVRFNESGGYSADAEAFDIAQPFFHFWFNMRGTPVRTGGEITAWLWAPQRWGIMWSKQPFSGLDGPAVSPQMPNSWGDTRVCFGTNPISAGQTMGAYIDTLINTYWTSEFNTDLSISTPYGQHLRSGLRQWADATSDNADCWLGWDVFNNGGTFRSLLEYIDGTGWTDPVPDSTEDVIPQVPIIQTFANLRAWVDGLDPLIRDRFKAVLEDRDD